MSQNGLQEYVFMEFWWGVRFAALQESHGAPGKPLGALDDMKANIDFRCESSSENQINYAPGDRLIYIYIGIYRYLLLFSGTVA